jgi:hypothetical protein
MADIVFFLDSSNAIASIEAGARKRNDGECRHPDEHVHLGFGQLPEIGNSLAHAAQSEGWVLREIPTVRAERTLI